MIKGQHFGIRARVLMAFGVIVSGTIVAAVVSGVFLSRIGDKVRELGQESLPTVVTALQLSTDVASLVAAVPALMRSENETQRSDVWASLNARQSDVSRTLDSLGMLAANNPMVKSVAGDIAMLGGALGKLHEIVGDRLIVGEQKAEASRALVRAADRVRSSINPVMESVQGDIAMASMLVGSDSNAVTRTLLQLTSTQVPLMQSLADLRGQSTQAVAALGKGATAPTADAIKAASDEFRLANERAIELLDVIDGLRPVDGLRGTVEAVFLRGRAGNSLFRMRQQELTAITQAREAMAEISRLSERLSKDVGEIVRREREDADQAIVRSESFTNLGVSIVMLIAMVSLIAAVLIVWLYVGRNLVRRIVTLGATMERLAQGDLTVEAPPSRGKEELDAMTATVTVFKENAVTAERLRVEQEADRASREARARRREEVSQTFADSFGKMANEVTSAAMQLDSTARGMSGVASQTTAQTEAVTRAAEEASANVSTVAASSEELAASIGEIPGQISRSADIAHRAAQQAARTDEVVRELSEGARKIGDVVDLITSIASQTNLLALNATIEAARAGEAGKGFAVVASEVKGLASQTTHATEEISQQITQIQSATNDAARAINAIVATIGEVSETFTSISAAIEEQGAATNEIARNVQQAAIGTRSVTETIGDVNAGAGKTGEAASQVLNASAVLSKQAEQLNAQVASFISQMKVA